MWRIEKHACMHACVPHAPHEVGLHGLLYPLLEAGEEGGGPVIVRRDEQHVLRGDEAADVAEVNKDAPLTAQDAIDL